MKKRRGGKNILEQYAIMGIMFLGAIAFSLAAIILSRLLQTHNPYDEKITTYECGVDAKGSSWVQFKISYFLYALVFVIFDVEIIFLYPWALKFQSLGLFALVEMFIFLTILVFGFIYAWKEGALEWK